MPTSKTADKKLSAKEIDEILSSEENFALYVATLTVEQIDTYLSAIKSDTSMKADVKKGMAELFMRAREERIRTEQQIGWKLAPAVEGIATVVALNEQIKQLEEIQKNLK